MSRSISTLQFFLIGSCRFPELRLLYLYYIYHSLMCAKEYLYRLVSFYSSEILFPQSIANFQFTCIQLCLSLIKTVRDEVPRSPFTL